MGILNRVFGGEDVEDQFRIIIDELTDSPDKVFVWQFPGMMNEDLELLLENEGLRDILSHDMQSHHVLTTAEVEIDELVLRDGNTIVLRDDIYHAIKEKEDGTSG